MSKRIFSKRMVIMLIILAVVFGLIFGFKAFMGKMMNDFFDNMPQPAAAHASLLAGHRPRARRPSQLGRRGHADGHACD